MTGLVSDLCDVECRKLLELYLQQRFDELSEQLLAILEHLRAQAYLSLDHATQGAIDRFVKHFLYLFTQPDYQLSDQHVLRFLVMNPVIAEVVAMSGFKTTDAYLNLLKNQPANFVKVLTLYSARNAIAFDRQTFVGANAWLATAWFNLNAGAYRSGLVREDVAERLAEHLRFVDPRLTFLPESCDVFFGSTYVGGDVDRIAKAAINSAVRRQFGDTPIRNHPRPRRMAVVSGTWFPQHPVYRNYFAYLAALQDYHLTLIWLGSPSPDMDPGLFQEVKHVRLIDGRLTLDTVAENDFQVVYFTDVGMTPESVILANLRLAPIQVAALGHSVSTWGAQIDYFLSGADVEIPDHPERNYSERLVLLPGCGVIYNRPDYSPRYSEPTASEFIINCPWASPKINYRFCRTLQELIRRASRPVKLRLFSGFGLVSHNGFVNFERELAQLLGAGTAEVIPFRTYADYMALMEEGQFSLDSYHFGGCNTVVDSLWVARPIDTWQGDKWYNRIGSQLLRMAGVAELAATSELEYLDIALRLIADDAWRKGLQQRLRATDFDKSLFSTGDAKYFPQAIAYLVAQHDRLQGCSDRTPIRIERESA
jgi:hypothetical protein